MLTAARRLTAGNPEGQRTFTKPSQKSYDVVILGGGAAGLAAAIAAAAFGLSVLILEKNDRPARKVQAAGNGRCNLSNRSCSDWPTTEAFFHSIGLYTREGDDGRLYPHSEDGRDVVRCLVREARNRGVEVVCGCPALDIQVLPLPANAAQRNHSRSSLSFTVAFAGGSVGASRVLMAPGGKAGPVFGTTGDGYRWARKLGHQVKRTFPVLTGIRTRENMTDLGLSGVRQKGEALLFRKGEEVFRERGEIQYTDAGLSGICIFNMTRFMDLTSEAREARCFSDFLIWMDFMPDFSQQEVSALYRKNLARCGGQKTEALTSLVKQPLARVIGEGLLSGQSPDLQLKKLPFHPLNLEGWDRAQGTRGGVPLSELCLDTMESRLVPGLYLAGEVLDRDFPCGGFNLQAAWTEGLRAGRAIGISLSGERI